MRFTPRSWISSSTISTSALLLALFLSPTLNAQPADKPADSSPATRVHGVDVTAIDKSVKPGDDFFHYANGDWIKRTEIPADRGSIGVFVELDQIASKRTAQIIEDASKQGGAPGSSSRMIADLYNSYMNEAAIEKAGLAPIKPHLDAINAIKDKKSLAHALGESLRADVDALNNTNYHTPNLFGLWVAPDFNDSDHYTAYLLQGGITLPDRDYYLSDSPHMKELREKYQQHVAAMFKLAGYSDPDARAARVVALEKAIAAVQISLEDSEDIHHANNPWKPADFAVKAPGLDWKEYFAAAGLSKQPGFIVWQPSAFKGEAALVESTPIDSWKDYLAYHQIEEYAGVLPKAFVDERFDFWGKTLSGTTQQRPRWRRGVGVVNGLIGDEVGKIYAQKYFSPQAKAEAQEMVANIIAAFRKRIDGLTWMNPKTKAEAQEKLNTLYVGVGYPDTWHDYKELEIKADDIFGNLWRGDLFYYHQQISRLGKNIDRHEWSMTPQTVNAVNLPLQNALNFPAAILEPPFFDAKANAAFNYGAIGTVIGHEISHTFDSEGAAFDSKGRVRNWWTPEDFEHFQAATKKLADQYDTYHPFADIHINGKQTLSENIADVAGVAAAFDGYRASLKGQPAPVQDGLTGDQQFFLAFGQAWASKTREASLRQQVATDPHAPGEFRTATVRNQDAWYPAFDVKPGDKLYLAPEERVRIW
jgi:putative endopeptidase